MKNKSSDQMPPRMDVKDGALRASRHLNPYVRKAWGLEQAAAARPFAPEQRIHLDYHRQHIFEKTGGGRRSVSET
jgi:hypothetical protein